MPLEPREADTRSLLHSRGGRDPVKEEHHYALYTCPSRKKMQVERRGRSKLSGPRPSPQKRRRSPDLGRRRGAAGDRITAPGRRPRGPSAKSAPPLTGAAGSQWRHRPDGPPPKTASSPGPAVGGHRSRSPSNAALQHASHACTSSRRELHHPEKKRSVLARESCERDSRASVPLPSQLDSELQPGSRNATPHRAYVKCSIVYSTPLMIQGIAHTSDSAFPKATAYAMQVTGGYSTE